MSYDSPTVPVRVECDCPRPSRGIPLHMISDTLTTLRDLVDMSRDIQPDTPVSTFRCRFCKTIVEVTAGDLHLT